MSHDKDMSENKSRYPSLLPTMRPPAPPGEMPTLVPSAPSPHLTVKSWFEVVIKRTSFEGDLKEDRPSRGPHRFDTVERARTWILADIRLSKRPPEVYKVRHITELPGVIRIPGS